LEITRTVSLNGNLKLYKVLPRSVYDRTAKTDRAKEMPAKTQDSKSSLSYHL